MCADTNIGYKSRFTVIFSLSVFIVTFDQSGWHPSVKKTFFLFKCDGVKTEDSQGNDWRLGCPHPNGSRTPYSLSFSIIKKTFSLLSLLPVLERPVILKGKSEEPGLDFLKRTSTDTGSRVKVKDRDNSSLVPYVLTPFTIWVMTKLHEV